MKNIYIFVLFVVSNLFSAQQNFELTTMRIGPYTIHMKKPDAEKIADKKLLIFEDFEKKNTVNYSGETIQVEIQNSYINEQEKEKESIVSLSTNSPKFKTKSGMGVGNTKNELIETYKNYPNFSVSQGMDKSGSYSKTISYFVLTDIQSGTMLSFKLESDVVTEVSIYIDEGC